MPTPPALKYFGFDVRRDDKSSNLWICQISGFCAYPRPWWGVMILIFGTFSALLGVIYALKERTSKNYWLIPALKCRHYSYRYRTLPDFSELRFHRFSDAGVDCQPFPLPQSRPFQVSAVPDHRFGS